MPELPEVETIRRGLEELIMDHTIVSTEIRLPKMVRGDLSRLHGAKIQSIRRRGKGLLIDLDNNLSLAVHVKMTGQLIYRSNNKTKNLHPVLGVNGDLPNKWTHVIFTLVKPSERRHPGHSALSSWSKDLSRISPGEILDSARMTNEKEAAYLFYNDVRQFGWLHVVATREAENLPFFQALGPEPLKNLDERTFAHIVERSKTPIKQVLMDQSRLAGVGNIYANDALFHARIHPLRPANELSNEEKKRLFHSIEYVLREGIKAGGASEENFVNALGEKGFYQEHFLVYKQTGKPCPRCGTAIERIVVGGRGTFFCPHCQV